MIKRISSEKSGRSDKTLLKMDSFSMNDSSSETQNKKIRNKESYKEIYLDKIGLGSSTSVRRKNHSLLTRFFNNSLEKEIFKSSVNHSFRNNNTNDSKISKNVSSSFLTSPKHNLSVRKEKKKIIKKILKKISKAIIQRIMIL